MKIPYKEAEELGLDYEDVFLLMFAKLDSYVKKISGIHPNGAINDIPAYALQIFKKMLNMWESIYILYSNNKDYVSIASLCRSILDSLAIINHIYLEPCSKELEIKHYLYILDCLNGRIKILSNKIEYDGGIEYDIFLELKKHLIQTREQDEEIKKYILDILYSYGDIIDNSIIENANWKYKTLNSKNKLTWKELYQKIDSHPTLQELFEDFSIFVHGLSLSNLDYSKYEDCFEPIFSVSIECLGVAIKAVEQIYKNEINL